MKRVRIRNIFLLLMLGLLAYPLFAVVSIISDTLLGADQFMYQFTMESKRGLLMMILEDWWEALPFFLAYTALIMAPIVWALDRMLSLKLYQTLLIMGLIAGVIAYSAGNLYWSDAAVIALVSGILAGCCSIILRHHRLFGSGAA